MVKRKTRLNGERLSKRQIDNIILGYDEQHEGSNREVRLIKEGEVGDGGQGILKEVQESKMITKTSRLRGRVNWMNGECDEKEFCSQRQKQNE